MPCRPREAPSVNIRCRSRPRGCTHAGGEATKLDPKPPCRRLGGRGPLLPPPSRLGSGCVCVDMPDMLTCSTCSLQTPRFGMSSMRILSLSLSCLRTESASGHTCTAICAHTLNHTLSHASCPYPSCHYTGSADQKHSAAAKRPRKRRRSTPPHECGTWSMRGLGCYMTHSKTARRRWLNTNS